MKAHDVRHLRVCCFCNGLGDNRTMLRLRRPDRLAHDTCAVQRMPEAAILQLPIEERDKITLGAAGVELMRKLLDGVRGAGHGV